MKRALLASVCAAALLFAFTPLAQAETDAAKVSSAKESAKESTKEAAGKSAKSSKNGRDYVILKIDGEDVKFSEVEEAWKMVFGGGSAPEFNEMDEKVKQSIMREVISKRVVSKQALKEGFESNEDYKKRLEQAKRQLLIQTYVESKTKGVVTDEKVKAAYQEEVAKLKDKEEVRARHILVATEQEAKDIAKQLKEGGDFAAVAKEKSTDKGSGAEGGDLGYFTEERMVPEFAKTAFALKKGEISEPVKTEFGWHVIKLEDRRKVEVPKFDQVKSEIEEDLIEKEVSKILNGLLEKTDIQYFAADGKTKTFYKDPKAFKAEDAKGADAAKDASGDAGKDAAKKDEKKEDKKADNKADASVKKEGEKADKAAKADKKDSKKKESDTANDATETGEAVER